MTELETQLRSWTPRRPSARLKLRIFAAARDLSAPGWQTATGPAPEAQGHASEMSGSIPAFTFLPPRRATCESSSPFRLTWFAPAAAALAIFCVLFAQRNNPAPSTPARSGAVMAMVFSNQSAAACLTATFHSAQNALPAETLEWTNTRSFNSSTNPLSTPSSTN